MKDNSDFFEIDGIFLGSVLSTELTDNSGNLLNIQPRLFGYC
jgi:hypothetical protein